MGRRPSNHVQGWQYDGLSDALAERVRWWRDSMPTWPDDELRLIASGAAFTKPELDVWSALYQYDRQAAESFERWLGGKPDDGMESPARVLVDTATNSVRLLEGEAS